MVSVIEAVMQGVKNGLERYRNKLFSELKIRCPVDTGRMRNSIIITGVESDGGFKISVNVDYADYVEEGFGGTEEEPKTMWSAKLKRGDAGPSTIPFIAPSVYQNRDFLSRKIQEAIKNELIKLK